MSNEKLSSQLLDLLLVFEQLEDKKKAQMHLSHFLSSIGFEISVKHTNVHVYLTIYSESTAISLLWKPSDNHYTAHLKGLTSKQLTHLSIDIYSAIWEAFDAYIHTTWQLPKRYKSILGGLSQGRSIENIAIANSLSIPSINRYLKIIRHDLGARTNPHAISIALRNHWL